MFIIRHIYGNGWYEICSPWFRYQNDLKIKINNVWNCFKKFYFFAMSFLNFFLLGFSNDILILLTHGRAKHIKASPHAHCSKESNAKKHGVYEATKDESMERILSKVSIMFWDFLHAPVILFSETVCIVVAEGETGCWKCQFTWRIVHYGGDYIGSKFSWRLGLGLWRCYPANNYLTATHGGRPCACCWGGMT